MTAEILLNRLEGVRRTGDGKWRARCPAHDSMAQTLAVAESDDGRVLVHCFAGCDVGAVCEAVGIGVSDLFPPRRDERNSERRFDWRGEAMAKETLNLAADLLLRTVIASSDVSRGIVLSERELNYLARGSQMLEDNLAKFGIRELKGAA